MRMLSALLIALALTGALHAEVIVLAPSGSVLPYGESADYQFTPTGDFRSVRLNLEVRMDAPTASGSTHVMKLLLNGEGVGGAASRTAPRLLNKPLVAKMASGLEIPWVRGFDWRVVYSPDFELVASERAGSSRILDVSPYRLVLDITDLVQRDTANTLTIRHLGAGMGLRRFFPDNPSLDMVFNELSVELSGEAAPAVATRPTEVFSADRLMVQPPATVDVRQAVTVDRDGGMTVSLPDMTARVVSRFSWQGGGFNVLGTDLQARQQQGWRVEVRGGGERWDVVGVAPEYRVERSITFAADHLEISDLLTNTTDADIGLAFANELRLPDQQIADIYLGGNPDPAVTSVAGMENTTAFVLGQQAGVGLLARDDVYRIQGIIYYEGGTGIRSDCFCLPARGSYTVRWSLYPVLRPDYYDFINLCRRDLQVNWTVPGGFQFGLTGLAAMDDDKLQAQIAESGLAFISSGVWFDRGGEVPCYHGAHMLQAKRLQELQRDACAKLHRVAPQVKSLIYLHCFINTDPRGPELYPDARIITERGGHFENTGYTRSSGIPFLYYYPAVGNSYLEAMKRVVDMCLDEDQIGADGIYWDEVEMISTARTFDTWDGHSALLDEQHRISRKFADVHLISLPAKVALTEYIRAKGGVIIGNSCPRTETMMQLGFPRFVETATEWYPARAHLYTPISLGDHHVVKTFADLLADIRLKLMWGTLYYYYSRPPHPHPTITQHMFPFTPVELHRGWLVGRERIITAVPGTFTFGDEAAVRVYWYGADGALTEKTGQQSVAAGRRLIRLDLGAGEMAVIERE